MISELKCLLSESPFKYSVEEKSYKFDKQAAARFFHLISPLMQINKQTAGIDAYVSTSIGLYSDTLDVVKALQSRRVKKMDILTKEMQSDASIPQSLIKLATTITLVSLQVLNARLGGIVMTSINLMGHLKELASAIRSKNKKRCLETLGNVLCSGLTLAAQLNGGPEIVLASLVGRLLSTLYSAVKDLQIKDRYIEGIAKLLLASIYAGQLRPQVKLVRRKWKVIKDSRFEKIRAHLQEAARIKSPLDDLKNALKSRMFVLKDKIMGALNLGAHFSHTGGNLVKGANVAARSKRVDGIEIIEVEFKLTQPHRENLQKIVEEIQILPKEDLSEFLIHSGLNNAGIDIEVVPYDYWPMKDEEYTQRGALTIGSAYKISLRGVGEIIIGGEEPLKSLYNRVVVRMDAQKQSPSLKKILAVVGLEKAIQPSTAEETERLKIATLYDAYHPNEASELTKSPEFFTSSLDHVKERIIKVSPDMQERLEKDLSRMQTVETLPGRMRYTIPDLAKQAKRMGAAALMSGISTHDKKSAFQRFAAMLKVGALSSQVRFDAGLFVQGASSQEDHNKGSAGEVFTRLITNNSCDFSIPFNSIPFFSGPVQVIYSLKALETGTYQYFGDNYGTKSWFSYRYRPELLNFIKRNQSNFYPKNEVMLKDAISPKYIVGCVVNNEIAKQELIEFLADQHLLTETKGVQLVNGTPVSDFIRVGNRLSKEMVALAGADV